MILYLHGFNSSPSSHKASTMRAWLEARGLGERFVCPALPSRPRDAVAMIGELAGGTANRDLCLIGSSLGGFYATHFAEALGLRAVLLNPLIEERHIRELLTDQQRLGADIAWQLFGQAIGKELDAK